MNNKEQVFYLMRKVFEQALNDRLGHLEHQAKWLQEKTDTLMQSADIAARAADIAVDRLERKMRGALKYRR